ncbi:glycoside hydrolase family 15 protein [Azospirillum canadense]|uniref:glycoside hydrolase family 15 protein n=1 Tax=Azospirillum canadense TaxID=403962 RepID=UPI00222786BB|nr:glycoside hydrolase family 15 protein [Azospirillum canadense]MCW2241627.1 glucoamylase [Azospirillum canadense]
MAIARPGLPGDFSSPWASSAKDFVLTALGSGRVWVTIAQGVPTEIFWPSTGRPQVRRLGFLVCKGEAWTDVAHGNAYRVSSPDADLPLSVITHEGPGFRLDLRVLADGRRDVALVEYRLEGEGLRLFTVLEPRLDGQRDSAVWVENGLVAGRPGTALCLVGDRAFRLASVGRIGDADRFIRLLRDGTTAVTARTAGDGAALVAEVEPDQGVLALAFGTTPEGARVLARSSLASGSASVRAGYAAVWQDWAKSLRIPAVEPELAWQAHRSAMVIKAHEDRTFPGAVVASLSIPWGGFSGDVSGGYHVVWTRDTVEAGLASLAVGKPEEAEATLAYLIATQDADGHWWQSYFPDGRPFWTGIQLDEVGFPVLLAAKLRETGRLKPGDTVVAMVRRALRCLARRGPVSPMDRWEDSAGISPFTLGVDIAALVAGSTFLSPDEAAAAVSLADYWNERLEDWTFVDHGPLSKGDGGYYVRIAPAPADGGVTGMVRRAATHAQPFPAATEVGLGFSYLARLGLRSAQDPRMRSTTRIVDRLLRVETPRGVAYHRYNGDQYGEHADGRPFDGTGVGRAWPLLTGERGHLALLAGEDASPYLRAMASLANPNGLLPEQVWDAPPLPQRELWPGQPTGSATPLVWAHAEFLKLLIARQSGRASETLDAVDRRYGANSCAARTWHWRCACPFGRIPAGRDLVIEDEAPFDLGVMFDANVRRTQSSVKGALGLYEVRFPAGALAVARTVQFDVHRCHHPDAMTHMIRIGTA